MKRHPTANRPLIDYKLALLLQPLSVAGTIIGFLLNTVRSSPVATRRVTRVICAGVPLVVDSRAARHHVDHHVSAHDAQRIEHATQRAPAAHGPDTRAQHAQSEQHATALGR